MHIIKRKITKLPKVILMILSSIIVYLGITLLLFYIKDYENLKFKEESRTIIQDYLAKKYPGMKFNIGDISLIFPNGYAPAEIEVISDDPFSFDVLPGRDRKVTTDNYVECKLGHKAKKEIVPSTYPVFLVRILVK